jgi:hypothetical protein
LCDAFGPVKARAQKASDGHLIELGAIPIWLAHQVECGIKEEKSFGKRNDARGQIAPHISSRCDVGEGTKVRVRAGTKLLELSAVPEGVAQAEFVYQSSHILVPRGEYVVAVLFKSAATLCRSGLSAPSARGFEYGNVASALEQSPRGNHPRESAAHDRYIGAVHKTLKPVL